MSEKELNPSPKFPSGEYPELSPNPNAHDGLVDNTGEQPNTQVVTEPKPQERKGYTLSEIIALIQKYAPQGASGLDSLAPAYDSTATYKAGDMVIYDDALYQAKADINTAEEWNAEHWDEVNLEEALPKFLKGKFVRIMDAPTSTTLTDEEKAIIKEGVFINGDFLDYHNPILTPAKANNRGLLIGCKGQYGAHYIAVYTIDNNNKISVYVTNISFSGGNLYLSGLDNINSKTIPAYPSNTSIGFFICRKGTLQYYVPVAQDNVTSGDTIALTSDLGKAILDHLEVEINGHRCRYEYTDGNYIVYSSLAEADSGLKLQVNMLSYNTTNGELSFNQMTFTPDA